MFRLAGLATSVSCKRGLTFTTIAAAARSDKSSMRLFAHSSTATQTQAQTHPQAHHTQNDDNFQDKSAPLRADIKLLGRALGDTIRARDGQATLDRVEELRALSKAWRRNGTGESFDALVAAVHRLDATQMHSVARAFSHFLALANTAEQHHRERRRRSARIQEAAAHAPPPNPLSTPTGFGASAPAKALEGAQPGMLNSTTAAGVLRELTQGSAPGFDQPAPVVVDANAVFETLCDSTVELVFTAHPTQVHRRTTQRIFVSVAAALAQRDRTELPEEIAAAEDDLRRQVALLWTSDEVRREKPTPVDEAIAGLHVAEQVLWEAVPRYLRSLSLRMEQLLGRPLPHHLSLFKFGSWLGSDRDGNAFVTPDVTRDVILRGRWMAAELFYHDVDALYYELSVTSCNEALQRHIGKQTVAEPYREVLRVLREKLRLTRDLARQQLQSLGQSSTLTHGGAYSPHPAETATQAGSLPASSSSRSDASPSLVTCSNDILEPLELCYSSLVDVGLANVAQGRLLDTLRRVRVFGSALFHWDIRQESTQHAKALDAITRYLRLPVSYGKMTEAERVAFLTAELESSRPLIPFAFTRDPAILAWLREQFPEDANMIVDVIDTFQMISEQHPEVLNAYVISMTRDPSDVLAVYLLQKAANVRVPCRVVPLFETVNDLDNCVGVMRRLLDNRAYRRIVNGFQEIMIGYSDSAKSAGRVAANWAIFKAQQGLVTLFEDANVRLRLFHGRGGSVSRGGSEGRAAFYSILAQPAGSVNKYIRITEQGEVIHKRFADPAVANTTFDTYAAAVVASEYRAAAPPSAEFTKLMDKLGAWSAAAYLQVVNNPDFVAYFRAATPEPEIGSLLKIGSRPSRRKQTISSIDSLRAIPWVFAWTQSRFHLTVWLGLPEALERAINEGQLPLLQQMYAQWPFFQSTMDLIAMVLIKTEVRIASRYEELLVHDPKLCALGAHLRERLQTTKALLARVTGEGALQEKNIVLQTALSVRNPYVDPLNLLQAELLHRLRSNDEPSAGSSSADQLRDTLSITIHGIAAGMQNTG